MRVAALRRAICGLVLLAGLASAACSGDRDADPGKALAQSTAPGTASTGAEDRALQSRRLALVESLEQHGIEDPRVLAAMRAVPRHEFVPRALREEAYADTPLPIGQGQTISQPYIVALMTELAEIEPGDKVLEIGTGSGYQAAVLAELGARVYSIEIVERLGHRAAAVLQRLGYDVETRIGDGYRGWSSAAPFEAIVITAAPPEIPEPLLEQLAIGGRMVVPVGDRTQELTVITRTEDGFEREHSIPVAFVPMTGAAQEQ